VNGSSVITAPADALTTKAGADATDCCAATHPHITFFAPRLLISTVPFQLHPARKKPRSKRIENRLDQLPPTIAIEMLQ